LATALLGGPDLLLLDEPTVGLDPLLRRELWQTFASLAAAGTTLIVSSHVMEEATHCARLLLIRSGRTLFDGTPAALLTQAQSDDFDEAFISLIEAAA
jgi:ABC-2 type transport system ATP-binding protein